MQNASICSKVVAFTNPPTNPSSSNDHTFANRQLPVPTLLYLATQGGADVCNLGSSIGSLEPGKSFDALLVSVHSEGGNQAIWGADLDLELGLTGRRQSEHIGGDDNGEIGDQLEGVRGKGRTEKEELEGILERFLFGGDDRNIKQVYVRGRMIGGKEFRR